MSAQIIHALDAARAVLDRLGWTQPGVRNEYGFPADSSYYGVCIHGALVRAMTRTQYAAKAIFALSKAVAPNGRGTSIELVEWNDRRGRTRADVDALISSTRAALSQTTTPARPEK